MALMYYSDNEAVRSRGRDLVSTKFDEKCKRSFCADVSRKNLTTELRMTKPYTLPDGTRITLGRERYRAAELMFDPAMALREEESLQNAVLDCESPWPFYLHMRHCKNHRLVCKNHRLLSKNHGLFCAVFRASSRVESLPAGRVGSDRVSVAQTGTRYFETPLDPAGLDPRDFDNLFMTRRSEGRS